MQTYAGAQRQYEQFAHAPGAQVPRSVFPRDHGLTTGINGGYLYPIFCDEILPADTVNLREALMGRLTTLAVPIMHPVYLTTFYFAVPVRLLWENWEKFHGYRTGPSDTDVQGDFQVPEVTVPSGGFAESSLFDYMEVPPGVEHERVNALFFRAYNLIYNEWFRDQDLIDEIPFNFDDGPDPDTDYVLRKRAKRKDYLTSCRPWPQKGEEVTIPLGTSAPVIDAGGSGPEFTAGAVTSGLFGKTGDRDVQLGTGSTPGVNQLAWSTTDLVADLSTATASTVNQLREAFQIQRVYERDARSGNRMVEHLKAHWGVTSPDFRLQRPEFLHAHRHTIQVNPVAQTAQQYTSSDPPPGNLSAFATVTSGNQGFLYTATEHMVVLGIACLHADVTYQQGLHRKHWRGEDRFDYPLPALMHLGEQAVQAREVYADAADQTATFGYQERWAEYRYGQNVVTGPLRSGVTSSLDIWTMALDFSSEPTLNQTFIEEDPPFDRVLLVPTGDPQPNMKLDAWFTVRHTRAMPVASVPGMIDHL